MNKRILLLALTALMGVSAVWAQGRRGLRINEVMVKNNTSVVDDYGRHAAWIELFNSTFAPLEISSVYLTTDRSNPTMYPVPLGDVNTRIPRRQHVVFWADGMPSDGTFHTSFVLHPGSANWIGVYDADGKTLIDEVTIPSDLPADATYARKVDGEGTGPDAWEVRDGSSAHLYVTPSSNNVIKDTNGKVAMFSEQDEDGFGMTIMAMCIVFTALLVLCLCFYAISRFSGYLSRRNKIKTVGTKLKELAITDDKPDHDTGEEIAAIVMALHEHLDTHDRESTVLTINKVKRAYSPWSSKIYAMRHNPR